MSDKTLRLVMLGAAVVGMGITMPSCPGDKAMQQQIDTLQTSQVSAEKRIVSMGSQVTSMQTDMNNVKQLLDQMTKTIMEQKTAISTLDASVKALQTKPAPKAPPAKKRK